MPGVYADRVQVVYELCNCIQVAPAVTDKYSLHKHYLQSAILVCEAVERTELDSSGIIILVSL